MKGLHTKLYESYACLLGTTWCSRHSWPPPAWGPLRLEFRSITEPTSSQDPTHHISRKPRIGVDEWLRFPSVLDVFATADCSGFLESTRKPTLPALAQVAERQGKYLSHRLELVEVMPMEQMTWNSEIHLFTSMATIGRYKALVDLRQSKEPMPTYISSPSLLLIVG